MKTRREKIRSIALTITAPAVGFVLVLMLELFFDVELSKMASSIINLLLVSFTAFHVFPRIIGVPFGKVDTSFFLKGIGFYLPEGYVKHIILGAILAGLSLSGMLFGSFLSGLFVFDPSTVNFSHIVFSLNPGLWEELFIRGVLMVLLLQGTNSIKKASLVQIIIFGLMHVKGFDLFSLVDVLSVVVLAVSFTYTVYMTKSLIASIVYHFLHDAFLFTVQVPRGVALSNTQNAVFFVSMWISVGIGCLLTKTLAERFGIQEKEELYKSLN